MKAGKKYEFYRPLTFFSNHTGLSGTKNKPINNTTGSVKHTQLKTIQFVTDPTPYTSNMPIVRNSWKHVPSVPRIDVSANSEINTGATTQDAPVEIPETHISFNEYRIHSCLSCDTYRLKCAQ